MSKPLNIVLLSGNLGTEPVIKTLQDGNPVAVFSLKQENSFITKSGDKKMYSHVFRVVNYKTDYIALLKQAKIGDFMIVRGNLNNREYLNQDGEKQKLIEVVVNNFEGEMFITKK